MVTKSEFQGEKMTIGTNAAWSSVTDSILTCLRVTLTILSVMILISLTHTDDYVFVELRANSYTCIISGSDIFMVHQQMTWEGR